MKNGDGNEVCRYGFGSTPEEGRCWTKFDESITHDYIIENNRVMTPRRYQDRRVLGYEPYSFTLAGSHVVSELSTNDSAMHYVNSKTNLTILKQTFLDYKIYYKSRTSIQSQKL